MYQAQAAQAHIDDLLRSAEAHRRSKETRTARAGETRERIRRIASTVASLVIWPIKH